MDDNAEVNVTNENGDYYCPDAPNNRCIRGHKRGWRRSKECRLCQGRYLPEDDEDQE